MKKYAFLVENEIFDIIKIPEDSDLDDIILRWDSGFKDKHIGLDISSFLDAAVGSVWIGDKFDNSNVTGHNPESVANRKRFAFLDSDNIIFAQMMPAQSKEAMYTAAFEAGVSGMDITELDPKISIGWIWNGQNFDVPGDL